MASSRSTKKRKPKLCQCLPTFVAKRGYGGYTSMTEDAVTDPEELARRLHGLPSSGSTEGRCTLTECDGCKIIESALRAYGEEYFAAALAGTRTVYGFWLLIAYWSLSRTGWEQGPTDEEAGRALLDVLANIGLEPDSKEARTLLKRWPNDCSYYLTIPRGQKALEALLEREWAACLAAVREWLTKDADLMRAISTSWTSDVGDLFKKMANEIRNLQRGDHGPLRRLEAEARLDEWDTLIKGLPTRLDSSNLPYVRARIAELWRKVEGSQG